MWTGRPAGRRFAECKNQLGIHQRRVNVIAERRDKRGLRRQGHGGQTTLQTAAQERQVGVVRREYSPERAAGGIGQLATRQEALRQLADDVVTVRRRAAVAAQQHTPPGAENRYGQGKRRIGGVCQPCQCRVIFIQWDHALILLIRCHLSSTSSIRDRYCSNRAGRFVMKFPTRAAAESHCLALTCTLFCQRRICAGMQGLSSARPALYSSCRGSSRLPRRQATARR